MRVLGVDPGTRYMGWSIMRAEEGIRKGHLWLEEWGYLNMDRIKKVGGLERVMARKVRIIHEYFGELIEEKKPTVLAMETPFMGKNAGTFLRLGYVKGILYLLGWQCVIREFAPSEIKKMIAGKGNATKQELAEVVIKRWPQVKGCRDDITDAVAIAWCGCLSPGRGLN